MPSTSIIFTSRTASVLLLTFCARRPVLVCTTIHPPSALPFSSSDGTTVMPTEGYDSALRSSLVRLAGDGRYLPSSSRTNTFSVATFRPLMPFSSRSCFDFSRAFSRAVDNFSRSPLDFSSAAALRVDSSASFAAFRFAAICSSTSLSISFRFSSQPSSSSEASWYFALKPSRCSGDRSGSLP